MKCNSNKSFVRLRLICPSDNKIHRFMWPFYLTAALLHAPCTGKFNMLLMFRRCTCQDFFFFSLSYDLTSSLLLYSTFRCMANVIVGPFCVHSPNLSLHNISTGDKKTATKLHTKTLQLWQLNPKLQWWKRSRYWLFVKSTDIYKRTPEGGQPENYVMWFSQKTNKSWFTSIY